MRWLAGFAAALALCACAPSNAAPEPPVPVAVTAKPVGQWLAGSEPPVNVGTFLYAGGLELSAAKPAHFGGLSDLDIQPDGRLLAVSDEGQLVRGAWGGTTANFVAGQKAFAKRAKLNGLASTGGYAAAMESQAA